MIALADNDVILKLARCDLFAEFLTAFDVRPEEIRILRSTRFSLQTNSHRRRMGDASFARMVAFLNTITDITDTPDPVTVAVLTEHLTIQAGEAALFALCPITPDSYLITGDKRSLIGLCTAAKDDPACVAPLRSLAGRVYCFEQVLGRILDRFGFDAVRDRLIHGRECDGGLILWLGSGLDANEVVFREGLSSFLLNIQRQTSDLLAV